MGKVTVLDRTCLDPISLIGEMAGVCYGSDISDPKKNYERGLKNLEDNHGRTFEYPQVYLKIEGYSARVIREFYTHISGGPTRLQASTRYIKYGDFDYIIPRSIAKNKVALEIYTNTMEEIQSTYKELEHMGIPKEDIANLLPLGMQTTIVYRGNVRNLLDMASQRLCNRAYWEYRQLMKDILAALYLYSDEWSYLTTLCKPKCHKLHYCPESKGCGQYPKEETLQKLYEDGRTVNLLYETVQKQLEFLEEDDLK